MSEFPNHDGCRRQIGNLRRENEKMSEYKNCCSKHKIPICNCYGRLVEQLVRAKEDLKHGHEAWSLLMKDVEDRDKDIHDLINAGDWLVKDDASIYQRDWIRVVERIAKKSRGGMGK
jgi:hypothetical protein